MGHAPDNHWRILGSEQRPPRRDQVLKDIARAMINNGVGNAQQRGGGFDPYDKRLGGAQRDVWGQRRRA
jgi:hypothetical protein